MILHPFTVKGCKIIWIYIVESWKYEGTPYLKQFYSINFILRKKHLCENCTIFSSNYIYEVWDNLCTGCWESPYFIAAGIVNPHLIDFGLPNSRETTGISIQIFLLVPQSLKFFFHVFSIRGWWYGFVSIELNCTQSTHLLQYEKTDVPVPQWMANHGNHSGCVEMFRTWGTFCLSTRSC